MGEMGCGSVCVTQPHFSIPKPATEIAGKQSDNPCPPIKGKSARTPPSGGMRRARKFVRPPLLFLPDIYVPLRCSKFLLEQKHGEKKKKVLYRQRNNNNNNNPVKNKSFSRTIITVFFFLLVHFFLDLCKT